MAAEGFAEFAAKLADAMQDKPPGEALKAIALAYVTFGEDNIELYRLMFASRLTPRAVSGSDLDTAAGKAFELLRTAMSIVSSPPRVADDAYFMWAQLHGLVMLRADGFISSPLGEFIAKMPCWNRGSGSNGTESSIQVAGRAK